MLPIEFNDENLLVDFGVIANNGTEDDEEIDQK